MNPLGARIEPFAALIYDVAQTAPLAALVAPPYDLIDAAGQAQLYARSPYNVVRLELNRDSDPYASAAATLTSWITKGKLCRTRPAIFLYLQEFELEGRRLSRQGLVARVRLEEFASGGILPHERTFPRAREDRLRLLQSTRVNISSIFGLYPSGNSELESLMALAAARNPLLHAVDDRGIVNRVYALDAADEVAAVQQALATSCILIADGHHRYETALEYRRRMRADEKSGISPLDYVMMTLVAFDDPGLIILPTHRLIRSLSPAQVKSFERGLGSKFAVEEFADPGQMYAQLRSRGRGYIGTAVAGSHPRIVHLRNPDEMARALPEAPSEVCELDVSVLHALIFEQLLAVTPEMVRGGEGVCYTIDGPGALAEVASGAAGAAFLLNPPSVHEVERVSKAGATMPEKSTYFFPKLLTGLLMNPLD